jgi:hypothetical protein
MPYQAWEVAVRGQRAKSNNYRRAITTKGTKVHEGEPEHGALRLVRRAFLANQTACGVHTFVTLLLGSLFPVQVLRTGTFS